MNEIVQMYEVEFEDRLRNEYVVADSRTEAIWVIMEAYDNDRYRFDPAKHHLVRKEEANPKEIVMGDLPPFRAIFEQDDGTISGWEKRVNQAGSKGVYRIYL